MPNLKTYNSRSFIADIRSEWWNFVANFFNTAIGVGVAFAFTDSGEGCEVSTIGYNGLTVMASETAGAQFLWKTEDGRLASSDLIYSPHSIHTNTSTPFDETYEVYGGGYDFFIINFDPVADPDRLLVTDQDGGVIFDTGLTSTQQIDVRAAIPIGTESVRVQVQLSALSFEYYLDCEYRNA